MHTISAETLVLAKERLKNLTKDWGTGVCRGVCLNLKGEELVQGHGACHSWVSTAYSYTYNLKGVAYNYTWASEYKDSAEQFLVLSCHSKTRSKGICSPEAMDGIISWIAYESPFSEFVINKNDKKSLLNDGIILLCGPNALPQAQAMWVCKVLRYSTEGDKALDTWLELYKGGVNPLLAVLVCSFVRTIRGATFGFTDTNGHSTVFNSYGKGPDFLSLLECRINLKAADTDSLFENGRTPLAERKIHKILKDFCKPELKDDGWGGKVASAGVSGPDLVRQVLRWQATLEKSLFSEPSPSPNTAYLDIDL